MFLERIMIVVHLVYNYHSSERNKENKVLTYVLEG
jgi:hypothetical protein